MRVRASVYERPLSTLIAALVSSLVILHSSDLLLGFTAAFILVCVLPGLALTHLLREKLGYLNAIDKETRELQIDFHRDLLYLG